MDETTFQALHFDFGAPLQHVSGRPQFTCLLTAIYYPADQIESDAQTRLVNLRSVFRELDHRFVRTMVSRLPEYVRQYGDGWEHPQPFRSGRIACLARLLDAISDRPQLAHFFDQGTWEWFGGKTPSSRGEDEWARENEWFSRFGLSLKRHEERIRVKPGELLIIDNLKTAHGRIGRRAMREVYQMMAGIRKTSKSDCQQYRDFLTRIFH